MKEESATLIIIKRNIETGRERKDEMPTFARLVIPYLETIPGINKRITDSKSGMLIVKVMQDNKVLFELE